MPILQCCFLIIVLIQCIVCWKLDRLGIDEDRIELSRIVVYLGHRAFVSIPRIYKQQPVTLAELPWPEFSLSTSYNTKPFPNLDSQVFGNCTALQSAVTLDIDNRNRLYVLDKGLPDLCHPKLIVYDVTTNKELIQRDLFGVPVENLKTLVVDISPIDSNTRVIIGDAGNNSLLVYNLNKHVWWRLAVRSSFQPENNFIAPGDEPRSLILNQFAISKYTPTLYVTSSSESELYSIDLDEFRHLEEPLPIFCNHYDYNGTDISVHYVGNKFGPSSALFVDFRGNLYYIYERDSVLVKWNPNKPFTDENVEVILQDDALISHAVQIFSGPLYQIWALNSKKNGRSSYAVKVKSLSLL